MAGDTKNLKPLHCNVGQCGNQIGSAFWIRALEEYGIRSKNGSGQKVFGKCPKLDSSFNSFFNCPEGVPKFCATASDLKKSKITARALLIDMEERVVERFQSGSLCHLFDKKCSLTNHPGSGNNWAIGHKTHWGCHQTALQEMLRRSAECCDSLRGFLVLFSLGGGTGAGLGSAIVSHLEEQFPLVDRIVSCVHPGQYNDVITSPYNIALSLKVLSEHATFVIPADNKALGDICIRHRLNRGIKPFQDANNVIVDMLLNLTSGSRFAGSLNCNISDLNTLVPKPGLQYFSASLSPLDVTLPLDLAFANKKRDLLQEVCAKENQLLRINALTGQMLSAALLCRGNVAFSSLREYVTRFRSKVKFAPWSDPGVKTGLCSVSPVGHQSAMLCLANSTNMADFFNDSLKHFNQLYKRKAHTHHFTTVDGFEDEDFLLTKESLANSAQKYSEAASFVEVPRLLQIS